MPELPEVEVVKKSLINKVQNLIIKKVKINDERLRYRIDKKILRKIVGLKIKKIERRSKFLLFFFNKNLVMLVHFGMTGKFFFINKKNIKYKTSFYYNINHNKEKKHDKYNENINKFNSKSINLIKKLEILMKNQ